jgi:hypothetical protein
MTNSFSRREFARSILRAGALAALAAGSVLVASRRSDIRAKSACGGRLSCDGCEELGGCDWRAQKERTGKQMNFPEK